VPHCSASLCKRRDNRPFPALARTLLSVNAALPVTCPGGRETKRDEED
jgi:hypothetical protein